MAGKITMKQKKFVDLWIELGNASAAAIQAGYSKKTARSTASQILDKPHVKEYIAGVMVAKDAATIAGQDEILRFLTSVMRGEVKEQVPLLAGDGFQELEEKDMSAKDRVKAAELLGKRHMLWTEKINVNATHVVLVDDTGVDED
jgi:phage terminase small subunit